MAEANDRISQSQIEWLFESARENFNVDGVCLWGYFFTDQSPQRLTDAGRVLERQGYRVVGLLKPSDSDDDRQTYYLHVEIAERHTVQTLLARNDVLYAFAHEHGLQSYDGMDVGPLAEGSCKAE